MSHQIIINTSNPEVARKAVMVRVRAQFDEIGMKHYVQAFVDRYPSYAGKEALIRRVYQGRADDAEIVRCFDSLASMLHFKYLQQYSEAPVPGKVPQRPYESTIL